MVFKRRRKDGRVKKLESLKTKLRTILRLLEKRRKHVGTQKIPVIFSTSDGRDVESLVRQALERVEGTLAALKLERELREKGLDAEAIEGGVIVRSEEFDHFAADAEMAEKFVDEIWKEKRGEGGE